MYCAYEVENGEGDGWSREVEGRIAEKASLAE